MAPRAFQSHGSQGCTAAPCALFIGMGRPPRQLQLLCCLLASCDHHPPPRLLPPQLQVAAATRSQPQVPLGAVSQAAGRKMGFRLGVRRSSIRHGEAGDGLFVEEGQARPRLPTLPCLCYHYGPSTTAAWACLPRRDV
jgi:hypothetical protein